MFRKAMDALWALFAKAVPWYVIPRDARVDPALFPEEEYPVICKKCKYLLHGLPDGKCPECGTSFERGRLLVWTYGTWMNNPHWIGTRSQTWCLQLGRIGGALFLLSYPGLIWLKVTGNPPSLAPPNVAGYVWLGTFAGISVSVLCVLVLLAVGLGPLTRGCWKRRRAIIDAIKQADSTSADASRQ